MIDYILGALLLGFTLWGWKKGVVKALMSLLGSVVAIFLAARYFDLAADFIIAKTGWEGNLMRILSFALGFILIAIITKILFKILEKIFRILTNFPLWGMADKIFGIIFGFLQGVIVLGVAVFVLERFPLSDTIMSSLASSLLAPFLSLVPAFLGPLLPEALHIVDSVINYAEGVVLK